MLGVAGGTPRPRPPSPAPAAVLDHRCKEPAEGQVLQGRAARHLRKLAEHQRHAVLTAREGRHEVQEGDAHLAAAGGFGG